MDDITAAQSALHAWESVVGAAKVDLLLPGVKGSLWRVIAESGQQFVLKRLPEYPPGVGPVDSFRVLCYLQASGVPVTPPIVTDNGQIHTPVGERLFTLLPFVPTDGVNHELGPDASAASYAVGAAIAHLDKALADCPWRVQSYVDDPSRQILDEALPKLPEVAGTVAPLVDRLRASVAGLPAQRTHGDCNTGNVLVNGTRVSGFIDIDHLPIGPRVRDLSYYLASRLNPHLGKPDTAERDTAAMIAVLGDYIAGYHDAYPLSERELAAVIPLILLVEIGGADWLRNGWAPQPERYQHSVRVITWITTHTDELTAAAAAPPVLGTTHG